MSTVHFEREVVQLGPDEALSVAVPQLVQFSPLLPLLREDVRAGLGVRLVHLQHLVVQRTHDVEPLPTTTTINERYNLKMSLIYSMECRLRLNQIALTCK